MIWLSVVGAFCFGIMIGWITYRSLRRSQSSGTKDIAAVIGAVGGAAVTALFPQSTGAFGAYCIGLLIGFFVYLTTAIVLVRRISSPGTSELEAKNLAGIAEWLGGVPQAAGHEEPGRKQPPSNAGFITPTGNAAMHKPPDNDG